MTVGVQIEFDSPSEFDLSTYTFLPSAPEGEFFILNDTDFSTAEPFLSNPNTLETSLSELSALLNAQNQFTRDNLSIGSEGAVAALLDEGIFDILEFGPVVGVPEPSSSLLLLSALMWGAQRRGRN